MNRFLASIFVVLALTFSSSQASSATEAPDLSKLAETGKRTLEKLENSPAAWIARCRLSDNPHSQHIFAEIKVFRDGRRQSWSVSKSVYGSSSNVCEIVEVDGIWHVIENRRFIKCRPYEAGLHFPDSYILLALADIRSFADQNSLGALEFEKRNGSQLWFRLRPAGQYRRILEELRAVSSKFNASDLTLDQRRYKEETVAQAREQLASGAPVAFDEATGTLLESTIGPMSFSIEGFRWLDRLPENAFALPKGVHWNDQTRPWSAQEYEECVLVAHDPFFVEGRSLSFNTFVLNLKSGDMRRVPFVGMTSMPCSFLESRNAVVVAGLSFRSAAVFGGAHLDSCAGLARVDLVTGKSEPFARDWLSGGPFWMTEVSPDGQYAIGLSPSLPDMEAEARLIKMSDRSARTLPKTPRLGGPLSWLPESDGIILSRGPRQIGRAVLCRLNLDGTLKDLRPGDWPLVLRKSRKILYKENESRLWHTCDLDGSNPKLYADGLAHHSEPAVSPDERQILFTRINEGSAPQLMLFELGKTNGLPATRAEGFTGRAVWR